MSVELFQLCVEAGVKRVIFSSTGGAIYGLSESDTPHKEDDLALPVSPYAIGKLTIEHYLRYFRVKHGLQSTIFRISNPYGERQPFHRKQGVIPIFLENIHRHIPLTVLGDGSMVRDYIYVKDVTDAICRVFEGDFAYDVYNLGSGTGKSINDIMSAAKDATGVDPEVRYIEAPSTYTHKIVLDTSRFEQEFGRASETSLQDGMAKTNHFIHEQIEKENE
jgi:UDP-glucose 4-epimerase